jgi:hypothetical protein
MMAFSLWPFLFLFPFHGLFNPFRGEAPGPRVTIRKNRNPPVVNHGQGAGNNGEGRYDNQIPRFQTEAAHGDLQSCRSVAHGNTEFLSAIRGPSLFKPLNTATG